MENKHRAKAHEALKKADKAHREALKHHEHACKLMDKADDHDKKYHQTKKDRKDESRGMKKAMKRSPAQRATLKKATSKKKRDEILGGEKANVKLHKERARRK